MSKSQINRGQINNSFPALTSVTYQNSWASYNEGYAPASYYKDAMGVVHLEGLIKNGTVGASAFTLPTGFRPGYRQIYPVLNSANNAVNRVDILTNGQVVPQSTANNGWVTLSGINFVAEG